MTQTPPGLESFLPASPALKRWAKLERPSGAGVAAPTIITLRQLERAIRTVRRNKE
jgi:hypothetical protein